LTDERAEEGETPSGEHAAADFGRPERPKLRRRPLGYKRADVDEAFEARDSELAELKQDIAALWLAFAQHDRMIRALGGEVPPPLFQPSAAPTPRSEPEPLGPSSNEADAESIGNQLSELDEVLAAIEMATKTLEHTYSDEIEASRAGAEGGEPSDSGSAATEEPGGDTDAEADKS
jgi:hypothetical protein